MTADQKWPYRVIAHKKMRHTGRLKTQGAAMEQEQVTPGHILGVLRDYLHQALSQEIIKLAYTGKGNARKDSAENETLIGNSLRGFALGHPMFAGGEFTFEVTINGTWYDFLVKSADDSIWMPINLKVSSLIGSDNLSSKEGLFYALTGVRPKDGLIRNWDLFCSNTAKHVKRENCSADYYYLVVEKLKGGKAGRVFWTSLLELQRVTPNGSNPPFQCRWRENIERNVRDRARAVDNLLDVVGETFVLRARALDSFKRHVVPDFPEALRAKWGAEDPDVEGDSD